MFSSYDILSKVMMIPAILIAFTVHEYAHAFVADRLGDKSQRFQGRLTLNPFVHVDPVGFLMLLLFRFGWAKPVQVNTRAFKNYRRDDLLVSIAGCAANILTAFIFAIILGLFFRFAPMNGSLYLILKDIILSTIVINLNIALFNLLPLPGLDGFRVFTSLFPKVFYKIGDQLYRYSSLIFIVVIVTDIVGFILNPPFNFLMTIAYFITSLVAG